MPRNNWSKPAMRYWFLALFTATHLVLLSTQPIVDAGDPIKIVNLDKLNTDADEEDPCPTPDHFGLLYARKTGGSYDIYVSKRNATTTPFGPGKPFIADKLADERAPFMHKDKYYFATNEVRDKKFEKFKNFDLMMQIGFQAPLFVSGDVNTPADEMYPWVTPAGKELYFSRKTEKGWKLFVANGPMPGPIGKAKEVGFEIGFHRASIGGNGLTMYLQGPLDKDKLGIFRSKRTKVGDPWSQPEAVKALNHEESKKGDMQPAVTADGARLYFVSDRPGGKGGLDIWFVQMASLK
jgi:WD40-like Beta Propeller Repeat